MSWSFEAIGTHWSIDLPNTLDSTTRTELENKIRERIADFDHVYSRFRGDSLVSHIAHNAGIHLFPKDADALFAFYKKLYEATDGAVTPLIGNTLIDAGYDATYSLKPKEVVSRPKKWESILSWQNPNLTVTQPVMIDVGAAGKGYLVDLVSEIIESYGITEYCVDAGGDIRHKGPKPLTIGLENPSNIKEIIGVAAIQNQSICGSAGNRRVWDRFNHTINPHTLTSPTSIIATWVIAKDTLTADGLATALFFTSPEKLLPIASFSYCVIKENGEAVRSPNFPAKLFTA